MVNWAGAGTIRDGIANLLHWLDFIPLVGFGASHPTLGILSIVAAVALGVVLWTTRPKVPPAVALQQTSAHPERMPCPLCKGKGQEWGKSFDEGPVVLQWPETMSKESFEEFEYWVKGILRRGRRKAGLPPD